jgi:hypothetical protein
VIDRVLVYIGLNPSMARRVKVRKQKPPMNTPSTAIAVTGFFINGFKFPNSAKKIPKTMVIK